MCGLCPSFFFRYFSPLNLTSTCIDRICVPQKPFSKHPFQHILQIALYTVCVLSSSSISFLSFDYGKLFNIFWMKLDQFTCCRNVPSVRNVFWGKNKTALGLSGRNLKTSPVKNPGVKHITFSREYLRLHDESKKVPLIGYNLRAKIWRFFCKGTSFYTQEFFGSLITGLSGVQFRDQSWEREDYGSTYYRPRDFWGIRSLYLKEDSIFHTEFWRANSFHFLWIEIPSEIFKMENY